MNGADHLVGGATFGPTANLHSKFLPWIWGPAADLVIILTLYTYRKIWIWLHGTFFLFATIYTLSTSIPILTYAGIIPADSTKQYKYSTKILNLHQIAGIVAFSLMSLVTLLGILVQILKIFKGKTSQLILFKKIHRISGYVVLILCKVNSLIIVKEDIFTILLIVDIFTTVNVIACKLYFPKLEAKKIGPKVKEPLLSITSVKQLDSDKDYLIFANYVYDVAPLRLHHPAGFQIIQAVKNKEVDRYIYGSCAADQLAEVPIWSHSYKSFEMLNDPIAKLEIPSTFQGFDLPQVECQVPQLRVLSKEGNIFQISLFKKEGFPFRFVKYKDISQLGRYFSLRINNKTTRLYTTVNFLVDENIKFLKKHLKTTQVLVTCSKIKSHTSQKSSSTAGSDDGINQTLIQKINYVNPSINDEAGTFQGQCFQRTYKSIPIMFKHYPGGKFTQTMINGQVKKLFLSQSKGEGLQLSHIQPGRVLIVVGGTGLFPFSDLIDLLYKEQLMLFNTSVKEEVIDKNPILKSNPFGNFTFQMLAAFNNLKDIHEITLQQLLFLAQKARLKITFKMKENSCETIAESANIKFSEKGFEDIIAHELQSGRQISKVWICGPPKMNQSISKLLRQRQKTSDFYLIV